MEMSIRLKPSYSMGFYKVKHKLTLLFSNLKKLFSFKMDRWKNESVVTQSCSTFCDPMDYSPPGSSVQGILQARILEWVAMPFSKGSSWPRDQTLVSGIVGRLPTKPPGKT